VAENHEPISLTRTSPAEFSAVLLLANRQCFLRCYQPTFIYRLSIMEDVEEVLGKLDEIPRERNGKFRFVICQLSETERQKLSKDCRRGL
jgi:hypothetical protein